MILKEIPQPLLLPNFEHAMIDLELRGLAYGHAVLQIGIALFNTAPHLPQDPVVFSIHPNVYQPGNDSICLETDAWWMDVDAELYEQLLLESATGPDLARALQLMGEIITVAKPAYIWADHCAFDIAHLQLKLQQLDMDRPWTHRQVLDSSTVKVACEAFTGTAPYSAQHPGRRDHDAASDAWQQALDLQSWWRRLSQLRAVA